MIITVPQLGEMHNDQLEEVTREAKIGQPQQTVRANAG